MWTRGGSPISLSVDPSTFRYSVSVLGQTWLGNGSVGLTCGGGHYSAEDGTLVASAPSVVGHGTDAAGSFEAISRTWRAGDCAVVETAVRWYATSGTFDFVTTLPDGAAGTQTSPTSLRTQYRGQGLPCNVSTEFPSFSLPPTPPQPPGVAWLTWDANMIFYPFRLGRNGLQLSLIHI